MIKSAKNNSEIEIWGKGNRKLQFIDVSTLANLILKNDKLSYGIYNLGSEKNLTIKQIAREIAKNFTNKIKIKNRINKNEGETLPLMSIDKIEKITRNTILNPKKIISNCI